MAEFVRGQYVWVPIRVDSKEYGVYIPKEFRVVSAGSHTLHLRGHDDVMKEYAYGSKAACFARCVELLTVYTGRSGTEYPLSKH